VTLVLEMKFIRAARDMDCFIRSGSALTSAWWHRIATTTMLRRG
jgi:hypothetical protein